MNKKNANLFPVIGKLITFLVFGSTTFLANAEEEARPIDDTSVFYADNLAKPNLLFLLDYSVSMDNVLNANIDPDKTRLDVLKSAIKNVLSSSPDNLNIGIMQYGQGQRGLPAKYMITDEGHRTHGVNGVSFPLRDINSKANETVTDATGVTYLPYTPGPEVTVRDYMADIVDHWTTGEETPIVDALYEAALYFRGERMHYGHHQPNEMPGAHPSTYVTEDVSEITSDIDNTPRDLSTAPNYISPIKGVCQANYIVMMSDGAPAYRYDKVKETQSSPWVFYGPDPKQNDVKVDNKDTDNYDGGWPKYKKSWGFRGPFAQNMQGDSSYSKLAGEIDSCVDKPNGKKSGKCGPELMEYLANNDNSETHDGIQTVKSFIIGFGEGIKGNNKAYLESLVTASYDDDDNEATDPVPGYFNADDEDQLVQAFNSIFKEVAKSRGTLASPGYSVNVKSGLEHEDTLYIPIFDKQNTSRWKGNLKKFKLVNKDGKRTIQGKNNLDAVSELGAFTPDALDYWSSNNTPDGADVDKGGVASKLTTAILSNRKAISNISCTTYPCSLNSADNQLKTDNIKITNDLLGLESTASQTYREQLIHYIRGYADTDGDGQVDDSRFHMGDMLHSEPVVITYQTADSSGSGKKQYIFAATNEGYLHAFDAESGEEKFAFMPQRLLKNIEPQYLNAGQAYDHKYGIDGVISYWKDDINDKIYLYFGLRRGGNAYYALDVTDITNPKLLWKADNIMTSEGFGKLGQSWSPVYLTKIKTDSGIKPAAIFTGGYDPVQDSTVALSKTGSNETVTMGNDLFIVSADTAGDASTGAPTLIWSLQASGLGSAIQHSIPGGARIIDIDRNHASDRMYFADTGGHIWRLDLHESISSTTDDTPKLIKLASLAGADADARKFYNEPDVALMKHNGKIRFVVSIGSGYRANPMNTVENDYMFVLLDETPLINYAMLPENTYTLPETITFASNASSDSETDTLAKIALTTTVTGGQKVVSAITRDESLQEHETITATNKRGWFLKFAHPGEKVLAPAVTFDGILTFTTLIPEVRSTEAIDQCQVAETQGNLYALNILTGKPALDLNGDDNITSADAFATVSVGEIPGMPQRIFNTPDVIKDDPETSNINESSCRHMVDIRVGKKKSQVTGYNACRLEPVYWTNPERRP